MDQRLDVTMRRLFLCGAPVVSVASLPNGTEAVRMDKEQQQHTKVERFLKLGYARSDILRVLESLCQDAQTNDILEELIKTCHNPPPSRHRAPDSPKLVSRGCSPNPGPPRPAVESAAGFRPVVIDGSNVAMSHGERKVFSCRGLQLAVNWFWERGVRDITMFVPLWRKEHTRPEAPISDQHVLHELERRKILVYTPSRCLNGKRVVCYDDRYIVKVAFESDGIIVSNDNYRDLQMENPQWKKFIEDRLLMYSFVNDKFMPPDDPLGRNGPTIDDFLKKKRWAPDSKMQHCHCPYGKKCTYGVKCKFYHPERTNQSQLSVADELRALSDRARNPPVPPSISLDVDEAFGSMEGSLSRLYLQDRTHVDRSLLSSSSGVASYSLSRDVSLPGRYSDSDCTPRVSPGAGFHQDCPSCSGYHCDQQSRMPSLQQPQPGWSSCPALPPHSSFEPNFRPDTRLPGEAWLQDGATPAGPSPQQRKALRSQLSTVFPQNMVEQVMNAHPHVSDVSKLIALIHSYRSSHMSF